MREPRAGNAVDLLVDDELWRPLLRAIRDAREEILLTQLFFTPSFAPLGIPLADELEEAGKRGARVRVLVNQNAAVPDSWDELRERFEGTRVEVARILMTPNVMHAKILVADGREAFVLDAPFEAKYLDGSLHAFSSAGPRRRPFHSVSTRVRGPAVADLHAFVARLFVAAGEEAPPPRPAPAVAGAIPIRLAWTAPPGFFEANAELGILRAYEEAILGARSLVYAETQYLTSPRMHDLFARAAERAEVVLVVNEHMDIPGYDAWQSRGLARIGAGAHPRLGAFSLWAASRTATARQIYVHSKVGIVDDRWLTIGSANLDSLSLHESTEFPVRVPPNVELNLVIEDASFAAHARRRLWAEHLRDEGIWTARAPRDGWLSHWRAVAERNARALQAARPQVGRVFRFEALSSRMRPHHGSGTRRTPGA
ncbi:MAG TPA: phosphatidylserine/phosphatidylglycerophosphate/cardiolipin synthase family protein [Candidatus Thermoplasmatota archaeon]|nr:phosphatidylserine/phosphatidylglycerophosphate/cardiolipin synthase family protein [Candidatus Thermoplasmatota archaeon]